MRKFGAILLCAVLAGCYTLPERKSSDDSVAVIKSAMVYRDSLGNDIKRPDYYQELYNYLLDVDYNDKDYTLNQYDGYIAFAGLPAGSHKITKVKFHIINGAHGDDSFYNVQVPFDLKPGLVTVLDYTFTVYNTIVDKYHYMSRVNFEPLQGDDRDAFIAKIQAIPPFKSWDGIK